MQSRGRLIWHCLGVWGCCDDGYTIMAKDRHGCAAHRQKGTCDGGIDRRLRKMMDAIESEGWLPSMRGRLTELETRQVAIAENLARAADPQPSMVLCPNAAEIYRQRVAELETALAAPEIRAEATEVLRSLTGGVVLPPDAEAPDASGFKVKPYNIPRGSIAAYYPETNNLLRLSNHNKKSKTPSAKSIPVVVRTMGDEFAPCYAANEKLERATAASEYGGRDRL
jgi:hypothetical protein